ncbi:MAG: SCO family protein [Bacteroidetes bacterium]|nr:SCO family protein [Bacteroidota bacterium]
MRYGIIFFIFFFSCSTGGDQKKPVADTVGNISSGSQRLMLYYPTDSTDKNGNKTYHTIPGVQLIQQNGKLFSTNSLNGKIVVSDFFFANCKGPCPRMTSQLARVQSAFAGNPDVKIISYTVDPDRDTAAALLEYAKRFNADSSQWKFVTGPKKKLYDLARYGFYMSVDSGDGGPDDFIHSDQVILVDRNAHIRGYYSGTDSVSIDTMISDIKTLLKQQ